MNRRRQSFSKHPIERKYLILIIAAMTVPTLVTAACLYYLIWQTVAHELAIPELIAEALFPALERVNVILALGIPAIFILMFWMAVRLTNRFAGPIHRIERTLDDMIQSGDFSKPLRVRQGDDLWNLVEKINAAIKSCRQVK